MKQVITKSGEVLQMNDSETEVFHFGTWKEIQEDQEGDLYFMGGLQAIYFDYLTPVNTTNPQSKEQSKEVGFTGGEWKLDKTFYHIENTCVTDTNGNTIAECYRNAYHKDRKIAEANAQRIVLCVNNHDALVSALKEVIEKLTENKDATATWRKHQPSIDKAKALLTTIDNK